MANEQAKAQKTRPQNESEYKVPNRKVAASPDLESPTKELAMRDEPNVEIRRPNTRSSDTTKGVGSYGQQDGGYG
ncbi:UNVERIFIED_CONTAM: hypothetical protein B566_EDAN019386, partial [Ephemera danica]